MMSHAQHADRFWARVHRGAADECWEWDYAPDGYGRFKAEGKSYGAHRFAYELLHGAVPDSLVIDHLCRNVRCVNPAHLEAVTNAENIRRGRRGRLVTHCPRNHEYTHENTYIQQGRRTCRECARAKQRARRRASVQHRCRNCETSISPTATGRWKHNSGGHDAPRGCGNPQP